MAQTQKTEKKAPASVSTTVVAPTQAGQATIYALPGNTDRIWVSADPRVCIYPWYGTAVQPGSTVSLGLQPGQTVYAYSPTAPAGATITIN